MRYPLPRRATVSLFAFMLAGFAGGLTPAARAQTLQPVTATLDRQEANVGETILLTVSVISAENVEPRLPPLEPFDTQLVGRSVQVGTHLGQRVTVQSVRYTLRALRAGDHRIGPITVPLGGQIFQSRPIRVRIHSGMDDAHADPALRVSVDVSNREPFVGQQVLYRWRFEHRIFVGNARLSAYDYDGFIGEDLGEIKDTRLRVNGQEVAIRELRRALFPLRAGLIELGGPDLICDVTLESRANPHDPLASRFGTILTQSKTLRPKPLSLRVRPLPPPPADFSGLVGDFHLTAELNKQELAMGDSATLEIAVEGDAHARRIPEPSFSAPEGIKLYGDRARVEPHSDETGLRTRKTFQYVLVPLAPGERTIPPVTLTYFDPTSEHYRTLSTPALNLTVRPSPSDATVTTISPERLEPTPPQAQTTERQTALSGVDAALVPREAAPDAADARAHEPAATVPPLRPWLDRVALPAAVLLAFGATLLATVLVRRARRSPAKVSARRRRQALDRARGEIDRTVILLRSGEANAAADLLRALAQTFLRERADLEAGALCGREAAEALGQRSGATSDTCRQLEEFFDRLDAARFGGQALAETDAEGLARILEALDGQLPS